MRTNFLTALIIITIVLLSCTHFDEEKTREQLTPTNSDSKLCFTSFDGQGIYMIDKSLDYKYVLYYYKISDKYWIPVSDGKGLPIENIYNYYPEFSFFYALSIDDNKILVVYRSDLYEFSRLSDKWSKVGQMPKPKNEFYYCRDNAKRLIYNRYSKELYYFNYANEISVLNKNYQWEYKTSLPDYFKNFVFISSDTILVYDNLFRNNPSQLRKWNVKDSTGVDYLVDFSDSVNLSFSPAFFSENGDLFQVVLNDPSDHYIPDTIFSNKVPENIEIQIVKEIEPVSYLDLIEIDFTGKTMKTLNSCSEFKDINNEFTQNHDEELCDKAYQLTYFDFIDNHYYLFISDQGYFYKESEGGEWLRILKPDYLFLNRRQD